MLFLLLVLTTSALGCLGEPCLVDEGCSDRATISLNPCEASPQDPTSLEVFLEQGPRVGDVVFVQGPLRRETGVCTQLACGPVDSCCNSCGAGFILASGEDSSFSAAAVQLTGVLEGVALSCGGDDSKICCPIEAVGQEVRLTGEVSSTSTLVRVEVEELCLVDLSGREASVQDEFRKIIGTYSVVMAFIIDIVNDRRPPDG